MVKITYKYAQAHALKIHWIILKGQLLNYFTMKWTESYHISTNGDTYLLGMD